MSSAQILRIRNALIGSGIAFGVASLCAIAWAWFRPSQTSNTIASLVGTLGAVAWAVVTVLLVFSEPKDENIPRTVFILGAVGAFTCGLLIWFFGHRHFGGFDHSALIDLAWRLASGQRPIADFPSTMPIGFVLGAGYAFKVFGVNWTAMVMWQMAFAILSFLWSYALLVRVTGSALKSALLAFAVQAAANMVTSYWWYNTATTTIGVLYFLSAAVWWHEPRSKWIQVSYVGSLVLLASMKPNIAGVLISGITLTLFFSAGHRVRVTLHSVLALLLFTGWLALERIWLGDIVRSYLSISGRGFSLQQFLQVMTRREKQIAILLVAASLFPWVTRLFVWRGDVHGRWLAVTAAVAGGYGFLTNGESKWVDLPLLILALWWVAICDAPKEGRIVTSRFWRGWNAYVAGLSALLVIGGVSVGALRQRVRSIGLGDFFEYEVSPLPLATPFFARMHSGPRFVEVEGEIARALAERTPERVFFGPRMQWAYAAFNRPSPVGQPVWWHAGVSYAFSEESELVAAWVKEKPDLIVFLRDDFTFLPPAFLEALDRDYEPLQGYLKLLVLLRRASPASDSRAIHRQISSLEICRAKPGPMFRL